MKTIHGGDVYRNKNCIDFSANINPLGTPASVLEAMKESLSMVQQYPDIYCEELKKALSKFHGVKEEQLICGNGAADLIFRFALAEKPKRAMVLSPCFAEYEQALQMTGTTVLHYPLNKKHFCLTEDFLEVLTENLDDLFLCNPNNPTGKLIPKELLEQIVERCKKYQIRLFMDECFLDFHPEEKERTLIGLTKQEPHIFVLRAFTKMYAVPGIRLGYGISGDTTLLQKMESAGPPWNVSVPAQAAGVAALKEKQFVEQTRDYVEKERQFLLEGLNSLGIACWEGSANYILLYDTENLRDLLLAQGVLIRDCSNYVGLKKGYYRIAVKTRKDNEKLLQAMLAIKNKKDTKCNGM